MLDKAKELIKNKKVIVSFVAVVLIIGVVVCISLLAGNKEYKVTFYSDSDIVLKVDSVKRNQAAQPPVEPQMTYGNIFKSWDNDFSKVKKNMEIHPEYESILDKDNVFSLEGAYGKQGDIVFVPVKLSGNVCLSGFDITIKYDKDALVLDSYFDNDDAVLINDEKAGVIKINFISAKNTTADVDICTLKFVINAKKGEYPITTKVNSIYAFEDSDDFTNDKLFSPKSNVINSTVYVI